MRSESKYMFKFILFSLLGAFLYLVPVKFGSSFEIPVGIIIGYAERFITNGDFNIAGLFVLICVLLTAFITIITHTLKPGFITRRPYIKALFRTNAFYFFSRLTGAFILLLVYFKAGPDYLISERTGAAMLSICETLVSVIIVISFTMPFLTDFGLIEFSETRIHGFVKPLFTCPGRSGVDLVTSVFGASNIAALLTKRQYDRGYYSSREAAVIVTNFSVASIPVCYVLSAMAGVENYFFPFYVISMAVSFILAVIIPRITPLKKNT